MGRPKKNLHEQATEPRILQAAEAEFGRAGFSAARLEDIAHTAQIQRSSLLYHFASKEELYAAVVRSAFGQLESMLVAGISAEGSFEERVDLVLENFLVFLDTRPALAALMLREMLDGVGPGQEVLLAGVVPLLEIIERFMDQERHTWLQPRFPVREAVLMIATASMVRAASTSVQTQLWGKKNSTRQLARVLLLGVQHGA
jgi:AcrR family transcriptional regulator